LFLGCCWQSIWIFCCCCWWLVYVVLRVRFS